MLFRSDGIGYEAAKLLLAQGHHLIVHGRNPTKLQRTVADLTSNDTEGKIIDSIVADLSSINEVQSMGQRILEKHDRIDVLINNAGVFKVPPNDDVTSIDGLDKRFAVNTIAPYLLTKTVLPIIPKHTGRVVNVSSAAEAPVDLQAVAGRQHKSTPPLSDFNAYSQSKLGITMWTYGLSKQYTDRCFVSVNPASMLGTKMVKEGFGVQGNDIRIGATILFEMATVTKYGDIQHVSGRYYDNDHQRFASPRYAKEAFDLHKCQRLMNVIDTIIDEKVK